MFRIFSHLLLFVGLANLAQAQIIWADPVFPTAGQAVTIFFDATEGTAGLANCNCDVYVHTGVITNQSTGTSDWKHVVTTWGQANAAWKMTPVSGQPNVYSYDITPTIQAYYGVTNPNEIIEKMAFVFRNATGSKEGKDVGGADIFYDVSPDNSVFSMALVAPTSLAVFPSFGQIINIQAATTQPADFQIFDNGISIATSNDATAINHNLTVTAGGIHLVEVRANNGTETISRFFNYLIPSPPSIEAMPQGTELGITYLSSTSVRLAFYAPNKQFAFVLGDFNDWLFNTAYQMKRTPDGTTWWLDITGLTPGQYYAFQYAVGTDIRIGDPYSKLVLDPNNDQFVSPESFPNLPPYPAGKTTGITSLLRTEEPAFDWQHDGYDRPEKEDLVIYEMLMRDFTKKQNYQTLIDTLDYFQRMGVNAIEFMPINEFDGNLSWGYNPTYHYALDKYYGSPESFKTVVDACHERGIAVILDVVFNHAHEKNPLCMLYWDAANFRPAADNPWLNQTAPHDFSVFYDFNHESLQTKYYVRRTLQHWLNEYHVDGFRFDLSKGLTQNANGPFDAGAYDATRIATIKNYANAIWDVDDSAYVILEHFTANTEEEELSDYGCMLWGGAGISNQFLNAASGVPSNLSGASYLSKGWSDPHLIAYMESHDEERLMYKNINEGANQGSYNIKNLSTALDRAELTGVFYLSIPGPKMLWQFFEMGYDFSINRCEDGTISNGCRLSPKPVRWDYMTNPDRVALWNVVRRMNHLRHTYPETFQTGNFSLNTSSFQKSIQLNHPTMNATVLGNFGLSNSNITPNFQHTGWWYEYFTGDSLDVASTTAQISLVAGEYRLYTDERITPPSLYTDAEEAIPGQTFDWAISPNPASDELTVELFLEKSAAVSLSLHDALGRTAIDLGEDLLPAGQHRLREELGLPSGFYYLRINVDGVVRSKRVVVR